MADGGVNVGSCNDRCGCPSPCIGGQSCRCNPSASSGDPEMQHMRCSCGAHCGCNPCTCTKAEAGTGKAFCRCGEGCTCVTCAS
ncbi:PREDICTED: metallothionein-like protein 4B [Nelumbo nucifera]|uniref:Metallothionein-like protein 4B n=2 Tax=Nelumbo nucifera TaxID=4432 RepID=A0A1U8Q8L4_NELNU|nr:PREDICTED: metallothionein-like protein 4B [Nelumbo nucifera]DAD41835.1 TPA_asm: hypothetical protein HUJ06_016158 [Nelumbo nucifera]